MNLSNDYFICIFSQPVQIFFNNVSVARIRLAETSQCLALQFPDPFAELVIRTQTMIKIFPVTVKRAASCHCYFQPERISEITILTMSCSAYVHVTSFLADIYNSCFDHNHLFILLNISPVREPIFYFLPAIPFRAGLCKAFRENTASGARKIFSETRKGPALLNPDRHGTNFAG